MTWPLASTCRYLKSIQLNNIRAFCELVLEVETADGAPRMRTLLIGRNGTCKSTLLRAVALGLADVADAQAMLVSPIGTLVGPAGNQGQITLGLEGSAEMLPPRFNLRLLVSRGDKEILEDHNEPELAAPLFVVAYGAGRFFSGGESSSFREYRAVDAVAGLFNHPRPLTDPELILRRLQDFYGTDGYEKTLSGIKAVLGLDEEHTIEIRRGGGVEIAGPSLARPVSLDSWADGYRVTFTWLLDFYGWALRAAAIDADGMVNGILLIDEIDQHLHPSMQAQVLPRLSELLPRVQIIASTHSPLVALGAQPDELVALHRCPSGEVVVAPTPDFRLYSVEDMLTDDRLFDTEPFSEEVNEKTERYRELMAIPVTERGPRQERELRALAHELAPPPDPSKSTVSALEEMKSILARHGIE